ncbi:MAG: ATP-dependent Clp protease proteolytic subunit [Mucispirillum sp.]|nr:ATP-dependent Clp protease proteolytic subunit [Mucispirillum sp.]
MKKLLIIFVFLMLSYPAFAESGDRLYAVNIDGVITNASAEFIERAISRAEEDNSPLLIRLDTPGGILDAARDIVRHIFSAQVPVIVFVAPDGARAASAGIFIAMAADLCVMSESSNIGAAHPVGARGENIEGDMGEKVLNDTVALIKSIAEKRGRNAETAVGMVEDSKSYTSAEALELKIIDAVGNETDVMALIAKEFDMKPDMEVIEITPTFIQSVFKFLADPNILAAALFLGIILIGLEFKMPGSFVFAGLGALSLLLFAVGSSIIPINYFGVLLVLLGFALLIAEIFITSFGLLTAGGLISIVCGLIMLFDNEKNAGVSVSMGMIVCIVVIVLAAAAVKREI